jgi:two-component sensor histidine kinase/integral membrane sensor domain MASE1
MTRAPLFLRSESATSAGKEKRGEAERGAGGAVSLERVGIGVLAATLMTASYYFAARYGLALLAHPSGVAVFWPASGIAVGALLVFGRASFVPVATGVAIATMAANMAAGRIYALAPLFAFANVVECLTVAWLAERFLGTDLRFDSLRRVFGIFVAATVGTALGAAIGAVTIKILGEAKGPLLTHWHLWFRSDLIGVIAITPMILGLRTLASREIPVRDHIEGLLLIGLVSATATALYPGAIGQHGAELRIPVAILFPPLLLLAIRQPLTYSPIGASLVAFILVACVVAQRGDITDVDIMWSQITIVSMVACSLSLSALIAERSAGEERRKLLVRELDHRVKNGLTLVQAVVDRSRENASSVEDFYLALGGRIRSMARTHSMLSREKWHGLELAELVQTELAPFQDASGDALTGPRILLRPALAQSLSLVLHELSTNAVKHGALSRPEGRVFVTWHIESTELPDTKILVIEWQERGLPLTGEIGPEGFGTSTIRDLLKYEADAMVTLTFPEHGANCTIWLPLAPADLTLT